MRAQATVVSPDGTRVRAMPPALLEVGDRAPAFTLVDQDDDKVRLGSFRGRTVVLFSVLVALT